MHQFSSPQLTQVQIEVIRVRMQDCGVKSFSDAPYCPKGIPEGRKVTCDCAPIKSDPEYGLAAYVCMARVPCPVRAVAQLPDRQ
jgi:hypothetical protein